MDTSRLDTMLDIGIDVFTHLNNNSSKGNELLELIVEILEPYFAKRSEHESLHSHLTSNSGKTSGSSKGINLGDSDSIRIKFDTVNRNIDDINYELTEIRKKLTSKTDIDDYHFLEAKFDDYTLSSVTAKLTENFK